jgi:hypothetical protein
MAFTWTEGNYENPVRVISVLAGIQTRHLPNIFIFPVNGINQLVFVMKMLYGFCDVGTTFLKKIVC